MNPNPTAMNGVGRRGPQGQMLQPKERPTGPEGYGTIGRLIRLVANVYDVQLNTPEQTKWVQYAVTITTDPRPGRPPALPPKDLWKKIWAELEQQGLFLPLAPVYDGRYMCFSPGLLPGVGDGASFPVQLPGGRNQFNVRIDTPIAIEVDELRKLYTSRAGVQRGDVDPALVALNTMMIHGFGLLYPSNRTTFYIDNPARVGLARNHAPFDAGGGVELWRGFFTSLRPTVNSLFLNVDTTTGAFVKPGSMIDVCCELIGRANGGPHALQGIGPLERIKLNRVIKTCRIDINQRASVQNGQGPPRQQLRLKISRGLTVNSARQQTFDLDHNNGQVRTVSVEDYFLSQYNIRLQYPDLPLVETKQGTYYPIELCDFTPGNKFNKRLSPEQTNKANPVQILKPQDRFGAIDAIRQNAIDQVTRQYAGQFGVVVGPQLKNVDGRVLRPPTIEYERGTTSKVDKGLWQVQPRGRQHLLRPGRLSSFGVLIGPGRVDPRAVHGFVDSILAEARNLGLTVPPLPGQPVFFASGRGSIEKDFAEAINQVEQAFKRPAEVVFAFFDGQTEAYDRFKALGLEHGIATQALLWPTIRNKARDFQTMLNINLKLNVKLRGTNFRHQRGTTSGAGDGMASWFENNKALIFGSDLSHMEGKPSIASVVMSVDRPGQVYIEGGVVQGLIEPSDKSDSLRAKRSEIVVELESIVLGLLSRFESAYPGQAPPSLIFYRDGVSEGEWEKVLKHELGAITAACNKLKAEHPDTLANWAPKVTFVLSVKRHHIRFLPANQREGEGRNGNIPAGTVVDTGVTDPRAWTWYGAHHTAIIGTTRPTQYVVMTEDNSMNMNDLQGLTSALAHSYQRCHRAVSIPAPVYYADLLAGRFRAMIEANVAANGGGAAGSAAGGTNASLDAQQRAQDLAAYLAAMGDFEQGREELGRFGRGLDPSMWWL